MRLKLDAITSSHLFLAFVAFTSAGSFAYAVALSVHSVCKRLYIHVHLLVFVISLFVESVVRYHVDSPALQASLFFSLTRTVSLVVWQAVMLLLAEHALLQNCIFYVVFSTLICVVFFIVAIHQLIGLCKSRAL